MTQVLFSSEIGGDGSTISDDSNAATTLLNDYHTFRLVPACQQMVNIVQESVNRATANTTNLDAIFQEQQAFNVNGSGPTSSSTFVDKSTLNTTVTNNISGCSLVSGKVRLANAGTYEIEIRSSDYRVNGGFIALITQNTTGGAITNTILGVQARQTLNNADASVFARVTLTQSTDIVPRIYYGAVSGITIPGSAHGISGVNNAYLQVKVTRLY